VKIDEKKPTDGGREKDKRTRQLTSTIHQPLGKERSKRSYSCRSLQSLRDYVQSCMSVGGGGKCPRRWGERSKKKIIRELWGRGRGGGDMTLKPVNVEKRSLKGHPIEKGAVGDFYKEIIARNSFMEKQRVRRSECIGTSSGGNDKTYCALSSTIRKKNFLYKSLPTIIFPEEFTPPCHCVWKIKTDLSCRQNCGGRVRSKSEKGTRGDLDGEVGNQCH